jgi:hypothetical protein
MQGIRRKQSDQPQGVPARDEYRVLQGIELITLNDTTRLKDQ